MFSNYFITAIRSVFRHKTSSLVNITGLAVSLACCIFVYAFLRHENSFDSAQINASQTYRIVGDLNTPSGTEHQGYVHFALAKALRNDFPQTRQIAQVYASDRAIVHIDDHKAGTSIFEQKNLLYADPQFLTIFGYPPLAGNYSKLLTQPDEVVLTQSTADKYFGQQNARGYHNLIGRMLTIDKSRFRISGIIKDGPANTNVPFKLLLPFAAFVKNVPGIDSDWKQLWGNSFVFITLAKNQQPAAVEHALIAFKNKYLDAETAKKFTYHLQPLSEVHTNELYEGTAYATPHILVIAFLTMGVIVLLTACINFINLATAQATKRAKEIGIRKTLGSNRTALMLRFMSETFILVITAAIIALLLAQWAIQAFNSYLAPIIDLGMHIDYTIIYFLAAMVVLTTLLAGYYPARIMAGYQVIKALKNSIHTQRTGFAGKFSLRKILVITQFAISQLLIIGTLVIASQMRYFQNMDMGYQKKDVMVLDIPENNPEKIELLRHQLLKHSQIKTVSFSSTPPTSNAYSGATYRLPSSPADSKMEIERKYVDDQYLSVYHIKLLAGRNLRADDQFKANPSGNHYNTLINKKTALSLGFKQPQDAIGKTMVVDKDDQATIVGVVTDFYNVPVKQDIKPCMLFYSTNWIGIANVQFQSSLHMNKSVLDQIRQNWQQTFPDHIYRGYEIDEYLKRQSFYIIEEVMYQAFKVFVALSVLIGCLGLYGLIIYLALQRQKEIGIRKVLGSSVNSIILLFSKEFAWLVVWGFAIAAPLAYLAMSAWLQGFAHRISLHAGYFAYAFVISVLIAAITIGWQAVTAALANPIKSLKAE